MNQFLARVTFRHLRLAVAVADSGNLVGAAKILNLTQPAVTKALQEAESLLGATLFERTNRGVVPTIYGQALVEHARLVITQLEHAAEHFSDLKDGTGGRVVVGTLIAASGKVLPRAIIQLRRDRPGLAVKVAEGTHQVLTPALERGELDLVVGRLPESENREAFDYEVLYYDHACLVVRAAHPLARLGELRLEDLRDSDWILPHGDTLLRRQIEAAFRLEGLDVPHRAVESVSMLTNRRLILDGDYIGVWPSQLARADVSAGNLAILPVDLPTTDGPIGITTKRGASLAPAASLLISALRDAVPSDATRSR